MVFWIDFQHLVAVVLGFLIIAGAIRSLRDCQVILYLCACINLDGALDLHYAFDHHFLGVLGRVLCAAVLADKVIPIFYCWRWD